MRSRVLIGAGAWLLGAVAATAGSLYAVDQLGQGLLAQHTKQVSVAMVNAELAQDGASRPARRRRRASRRQPSPEGVAIRAQSAAGADAPDGEAGDEERQ